MPHGYGLRKRSRLLCFITMLCLGLTAWHSAAAAENGLSFSAGVDFTTQYMFRGIFQEDQGAIIQPWASLGLELYQSDDGFLKSLDVTFGTWNSIQNGPTTDSPAFSGDWYESDVSAGFTFGLPENLSLSTTYVRLGAPDSTGRDFFAQEFDFSLAWDDTGVWKMIDLPDFTGLQPHFTYAIETAGASDGIGNGGAAYFELGFAPGFTLIQSKDQPVTLTVPLTFGFGSNYYEVSTPTGVRDNGFGYFDAGLDFSTPLSFMPSDFGAWTITAGVHFVALGNTTRLINSGDPSDHEVIGKIGISVEF